MPKTSELATEKHLRRPSSDRRTSSGENVRSNIGTKSDTSKHGLKTPPASTATIKPLSRMTLSSDGKSLPNPTASMSASTSIARTDSKSGNLASKAILSPHQSVLEALPFKENIKTDVTPGNDREIVARTGSATAQDEIERLRNAMSAQLLLNEQRNNLSRHLNDRAAEAERLSLPGIKSRVSPVMEESISPTLDAAFASPVTSGLRTASTESNKTIRGGMTPGLFTARTPSYPFPPMKTPRNLSWTGHMPFTALSPTVQPNHNAGDIYGSSLDTIASGSVTPSSTAIHFQPTDAPAQREDDEFVAPNLYDLSLMLTGEPGLDPWWATVSQMMKDIYHAERVTLSIPADATDIENVPWGQKATFSASDDDHLSLSYLPRGSSLVPSSGDNNDSLVDDQWNIVRGPTPQMVASSNARPSLLSRHSFASYEDSKRDDRTQFDPTTPSLIRSGLGFRSQSYRVESQAPRSATLRNAQLSLASLEEHLAFEKQQQLSADTILQKIKQPHGRVFQVLQALDYESDPLIDSSGVNRIIERGRVIALTRDYPYVADSTTEDELSGGSRKSSSNSSKSTSTKLLEPRPEALSRGTSFFGRAPSQKSNRSTRNFSGERVKHLQSAAYTGNVESETILAKYEEYEQAPPSPWSQSPAPSPAVRSESNENPFFVNAPVDESSFNPPVSRPPSQSQEYPKHIEAIGVDRSCTVIHIPLIHPLLSKGPQQSRMNAAQEETQAIADESANVSLIDRSPVKPRHAPIAILSILSSITPYPTNIKQSLQHLAPHLATSFSLCRHYSNLESEITGLSRKRPHLSGFGAVGPDGRPMQSGHDKNIQSSSLSTNESITSPSDYSGISRSAGASPSGTPGWATEGATGTLDRGPDTSPGPTNVDSYFTSHARPAQPIRAESAALIGTSAGRVSSKEKLSPETRQLVRGTNESRRAAEDGEARRKSSHDGIIPTSPSRFLNERHTAELAGGKGRDSSPSRPALPEALMSTRRQAMRGATAGAAVHVQSASQHVHTQLHSYGADFAATFQSIPNTSAETTLRSANARAVGMKDPVDMPPPSDRLKTLMLDTLPAHLFVAMPQTGEIVWVNNRYLTYRGQSVADLKEDPFGSIHPDECETYLKGWSHALRTGEQFSMQVRIRRFDGTYRWFYIRAVGGRDTRGVIVQWYGSYMDIHDQHVAEVKAARQEEIEASEAKHRMLANLIPQIIFAATEDEGITFANEQWLSYTGQTYEESLRLGFLDFVHPEDLAKCRIPMDHVSRSASPARAREKAAFGRKASTFSSPTPSEPSEASDAPTETTLRGTRLSRHASSSSESHFEGSPADLADLARRGVIKVSSDSNGRLSYTTEIRLKSKSGEYRWHLVRCVEIDNINFGSGEGSWFGACTDINDHKILETALKDAMDSKSKFLSNMSHEIRTPLIGISGMVAFLQDTMLTDEQADYASTISSSANSLLMIINDILDISKADSGMMKLNFEWFHPSSLVEDVHELLSTMAINNTVELNYTIDDDVPSMLKGDRFRIRQVLLNLIGNAIKFTKDGDVFTTCKVSRARRGSTESRDIMLEYSIQDTGTGFDEEQKQKMFKPFSQVDGSTTRAAGGTGLGLVISRTLVELHGGVLDGVGVPYKGATFTFTVRCLMPNTDDFPLPEPETPMPDGPERRPSFNTSEMTSRAVIAGGGTPAMLQRLMAQPIPASPSIAPSSPAGTYLSSASSEPSVASGRSKKSSISSLSFSGLAPFKEAASKSQTELDAMKFKIPDKDDDVIISTTEPPPTPKSRGSMDSAIRHYRPNMYSVLIVAHLQHSRDATARHIRSCLPKDAPYQITTVESAGEASALMSGDIPIVFTHILLNLADHNQIILLIDEIFSSVTSYHTSILILSDPFQRQRVIKQVPLYDFDQLARDNRVNFVFKPIKPSRFANIFDPDRERDSSTDRNRSSAQQQVATQKQNYIDAEKQIGNRGHLVLLVEDNLVNQKVLTKYLGKVGVEVEIANDGVECTEKVFAKGHAFYSLILCDLHMPRKDGYQTCRDIREWEKANRFSRMPIIALSANVMSDVMEKCNEAGFNSYVTKPVDFKALSNSMSTLLGPGIKTT